MCIKERARGLPIEFPLEIRLDVQIRLVRHLDELVASNARDEGHAEPEDHHKEQQND